MLPLNQSSLDVIEPLPPNFQPPIAQLRRLDFEQLTPYERVQEQYQQFGLRISGAIALQPSNPAFKPASGSIVLMPMAGLTAITISCRYPTQFISAIVAGARQITLTLRDRQNKIVTQHQVGNRQYIQEQGDRPKTFPQHLIELVGENITSIVFESDAPFTLNEFCCG